jgi:hypothetical protein
MDTAGYAGLVTTIGTMVAAATYAARCWLRAEPSSSGLALIAAKVALK